MKIVLCNQDWDDTQFSKEELINLLNLKKLPFHLKNGFPYEDKECIWKYSVSHFDKHDEHVVSLVESLSKERRDKLGIRVVEFPDYQKWQVITMFPHQEFVLIGEIYE